MRVFLLGLLLACGADAAPPTNRLAATNSPYLQRHAADPVAWSPWDDAALESARKSGKPIFLSIGYLACHWCAVMHEESFLDPEIASIVNTGFIPIKVDREERPDVDAAWLPVVQAWTGTAGWPFTLVLSPDLTPLFAGSYLPPRDGERGFAQGLGSVLEETSVSWTRDPAAAAERGRALATAIRASRGLGGSAGPAPADACDAQLAGVLSRLDGPRGGFGARAKFPQADALEWLTENASAPAAQAAVIGTLDAMAAGGLRDHVRGGFFRYTTDPAWRHPHFEKMLIDQAQLARLYLVAAERVPERRQAWREVAAEVLDFAVRELRLEGGGFGTGLDARSEGQEGAFYLWTAEALRRFGADPAAWGVTDVPSLPIPEPGQTVSAAWRAASDARPRPERDTKRVAAWNGRMLSALAMGGFALRRADLLVEARALAGLLVAEGVPLRRTPGGPEGMLEDQALVALGLLDLYAATGEVVWLQAARAGYEAGQRHFAAEGGGWVRAGPAGFQPWGAERPVADTAEPSGTAAMAEVGVRLALLEGTDPAEVRLALERVSDAVREASFFQSSLCGASRLLTRPPPEVVLAVPTGTNGSALEDAAAAALGRGWTLVRAPQPEVPLARDKVPLDGRPTAFVCSGGVCDLPTTDPVALRERLAR